MKRPAHLAAALSLATLIHAASSMAQGTVQDHGARHALALASDEACEVWRGDIHGNDPSAEITVRLCTRDGHVTGTFSWSSRESGWDRRALEGEWRDDGALLVARDTSMLEVHPLNGWTLCTADAYSLRRVSPDRLEGTYTSERCRDHGALAMTRVPAPVAKPSEAPPPRPVAAPLVNARVAHAVSHAGVANCSASPGATRAPGAWMLVVGGAMLALARRRVRA